MRRENTVNKKFIALVIGVTVLILLGGIQAKFLYGTEFLTTKPGFSFSITHNDFPTIRNEGPTNDSTDIPTLPTLNITINDANGDTMTIKWFSNSSGSWQLFGVNNSVVNGTYHQINNNFSSTNTRYWWNVTVNDGKQINTSAVYHFTTRVS
jgi:hypothetical protein